MAKFTKKEDIDTRLGEVEKTIREWAAAKANVSSELKTTLDDRLRISLIHHDAALEGEVLSYSEIKAAIDPHLISDTSLIPSYEAIKRFDLAMNWAEEMADTENYFVKIDTIKKIHEILDPETTGNGYRKENPLHRLYYHDISPPEKITYRMRKFAEWLVSDEVSALHPILRVAQTHHGLMAVFPWVKQSGRCARILSNLLLRQAQYPLAIIHSIDRQKYYESLRKEPEQLALVYLEAVETTAKSELQVYEEASTSVRRFA